jgi:lipopolysaccharide transport system ATP-binding protein
MKPIIRVENLSKRYRIGANASNPQSLREGLAGLVRAPFKRLAGRGDETIWALKDVSFEVQPGEVVGIIGRNGAGKSTLLKLLSRIVEPTSGRAELYGSLGSLLEVGTGFHPELTGRENVYLNGAIMGMPRADIERKFDEIVAFSEIGKFIDTPVKHYSSGMYLRLAFAVAAHLDPEILILDEVLAVGDASFQQKCLNKMEELRRDGRTVLFVSHNMQAVTRLCKRVIYLAEGTVLDDGPAHQIASSYLSARLKTVGERVWDETGDAPGDGIARLCAVRVRTEGGRVTDTVDIRKPVGIEVEFEVLEPGHVLVPNLPFHNEEGVCIFHVNDTDPAWKRRPRPKGIYSSTVWVPGNFLSEGTILVGVAVSTINPVTVHFYERDAVAFQVVDSLDGDSARGDYTGTFPGIVRPILNWTTQVKEY